MPVPTVATLERALTAAAAATGSAVAGAGARAASARGMSGLLNPQTQHPLASGDHGRAEALPGLLIAAPRPALCALLVWFDLLVLAEVSRAAAQRCYESVESLRQHWRHHETALVPQEPSPSRARRLVVRVS